MTALPLAAPRDRTGPRDRTILAGWALLALFALFMLAASVLPKFAMTAMVAEGALAFGWPDFPVRAIGAIELALTLLVLWPRTAPLGGLLMTALFGGTVATHLHAGSPWLSHTLFGVWLAIVLWGGLLLREPRLRALLPLAHQGSRP